MKVNLIYFKLNGKFYGEGTYETQHTNLGDIFEEVLHMQSASRLPGLRNGHSEFIALVDVPEHEHNHPYLAMQHYIEEQVPVPAAYRARREPWNDASS